VVEAGHMTASDLCAARPKISYQAVAHGPWPALEDETGPR
jgi:hypothetical protein